MRWPLRLPVCGPPGRPPPRPPRSMCWWETSAPTGSCSSTATRTSGTPTSSGPCRPAGDTRWSTAYGTPTATARSCSWPRVRPATPGWASSATATRSCSGRIR
ncbi:hypothetical protein NKH18_34665 [Streptomyces sp. M10(2022)]